MAQFLSIFLITNILYSIIIAAFLLRFHKDPEPGSGEICLYALGLGPAFTTLVLYYLLVILPHRSDLFYFLGVNLVYGGLALWGRNSYGRLLEAAGRWFRIKRQAFREKRPLERVGGIAFFLFLFILLFTFLFLYVGNTLQTPLEGHDVLQYAVMGKIYFQEKAIDFPGYRPHEPTGFYSKILHAPSFSLLATWERMVNRLWGPGRQGDLYFKSTGAYYGLLIIFAMLAWLSRRDRRLALLGLLILLSGLGFLLTFITFHIDSYRIFFLSISWIFLARAVKEKEYMSLLLLGVFSGFAAFAHSIGILAAGANILALFIFYRGGFRERMRAGLSVSALVMFFGGIHYAFDTFLGHGWIIFKS